MEYVLSVIQGIIVEVFEPSEWKDATVENFPEFHDVPGRIGFVGNVAEESVRQLYLRKRVSATYRKTGAANPIRYNF